jgi:uncharacterized protein YndB with AHSA1/START domain
MKYGVSVSKPAIRLTITFDASPHDVYEMLMDEKKHARFTAGAAQISRDVGGAFVTNNGYSTGTRSLFRTQRLSRPGGRATGLRIIIPR